MFLHTSKSVVSEERDPYLLRQHYILHKVYVVSDLVFGEVAVGVQPEFPISRVAFVMGNGGRDGVVTPDVTLVSVRQSPDALAQVDVKSRSETDEAFVTTGALSGAEVEPPSVSLVVGKVTDACQPAFAPTRSLLVDCTCPFNTSS